jgi:hypothetical protein
MAGRDCLSRSVLALISMAVIKPRFTVHIIVEPCRSEHLRTIMDRHFHREPISL